MANSTEKLKKELESYSALLETFRQAFMADGVISPEEQQGLDNMERYIKKIKAKIAASKKEKTPKGPQEATVIQQLGTADGPKSKTIKADLVGLLLAKGKNHQVSKGTLVVSNGKKGWIDAVYKTRSKAVFPSVSKKDETTINADKKVAIHFGKKYSFASFEKGMEKKWASKYKSSKLKGQFVQKSKEQADEDISWMKTIIQVAMPAGFKPQQFLKKGTLVTAGNLKGQLIDTYVLGRILVKFYFKGTKHGGSVKHPGDEMTIHLGKKYNQEIFKAAMDKEIAKKEKEEAEAAEKLLQSHKDLTNKDTKNREGM